MRVQMSHGVKVMFKAEHVAQVNSDVCIGCRVCLRLCQFGALGFSTASGKARIDTRKCYGCGVCRAECSTAAISLPLRNRIPVAASDW